MTMSPTADFWIQHLGLERHIEGGSFRRWYTAGLQIDKNQLPVDFRGDRPVSTAIYFLLEKEQFSAMHRIASDELWHFYYGDPLTVYEIQTDGTLIIHLLGNNPIAGEQFQCAAKAGSWFGARVAESGNYSLVGCTVAPGFDFAEFQLAERTTLISEFPQHKEIILQLTR